MKLERELNLAVKSARDAGDYLRRISKPHVDSNKGKDIKLREDREAESVILDVLSQTSYPFVSEESYSGIHATGNSRRWIIDPLDGSFNFYRNIPFSTVSIALWDGENPLLGVVYDFNRDELYKGTLEQGVLLNDQKVFTSNIDEKSNSILYTGFPSNMRYFEEGREDFFREVQEFKKVRLLGSATLSLANVACGRGEAYHEKGIMLWDVAAGLALVKFAGGEFNIKQLDGNKYDVTATNGKIKL